MDPLSDVLRAMRLNGAYFYLVEAGGPWSILTEAARELVPRIMPDAEHLISYHILLSGTCWGGIDGEDPIEMKAGDVIVFPHGNANLMSSDTDDRSKFDRATSAPKRYPGTVRIGPNDECDTTFICGFLGCDSRPYNPLLASLPERMHAPGIAEGWLSQLPKQAVAESKLGRVGSDTVLTRMAELMFIEVVRRYVEQLPPQDSGWLAGLNDSVVGPALTALHEKPAYPWTLADLSHSIAASRTVLAERFTKLVGVPPMQYLKRWRLQLAAEMLSGGTAKVSSIATRVGYESEAAFSRAFKKETGLSPATWRSARAH